MPEAVQEPGEQIESGGGDGDAPGAGLDGVGEGERGVDRIARRPAVAAAVPFGGPGGPLAQHGREGLEVGGGRGALVAAQLVQVGGAFRVFHEFRQVTYRCRRLAATPVAAQEGTAVPDLCGHPGAGEGDTARGVGGGGVLGRAQRAIAVAEAGSGAQEPAGAGGPAHRDAAPHQFLQRRSGYLDVSHDGHLGHFVQAQVPAAALVLRRHLEGLAGQTDARALVVDVDRMADGRGAVAPVGVKHRPTPGRTGQGRSDSRSRTPAARARARRRPAATPCPGRSPSARFRANASAAGRRRSRSTPPSRSAGSR